MVGVSKKILLKDLLKEAYYKIGIKDVAGGFLLDPWGQLIHVRWFNWKGFEDETHYNIIKKEYPDIYRDLYLKYKNFQSKNSFERDALIEKEINKLGFINGTKEKNKLYLRFYTLNDITKQVIINIISQYDIKEIQTEIGAYNELLDTKDFIDKFL